MKTPLQEYSESQIREAVEYEWLGLGDIHSLAIKNPFLNRSKYEIENPHIHILQLMRNPDYFYFTCKYLLNKSLGPMQLAILKELWKRPFPMLIGSRGLSKSWILAAYAMLRAILHQGCKVIVVGSAFRQAKVVFDYCEDMWSNSPILQDICSNSKRNGPRYSVDRCSLRIGESLILGLPMGDGCLSASSQVTYKKKFGTIADFHGGEEKEIVRRDEEVWGNKQFRKTDESYCNGKSYTKKVTTKKGYTIEGTYNHKIKVLRKTDVIWERLDGLRPDDHVLIDRSYRWHDGDFNCTEDQAYALGLMIGDGCWTLPYRLGYTTQDEELIRGVRRGTGFAFSCWNPKDKYHYTHSGKPDRTGWMRFWGLKAAYSNEKVLPDTILASRRECVAACIRGIYDTDGHVQINTAKGGTAITVGLTTTSGTLASQIQFILLHFGIVSCLKSRQRNKKDLRIYELLICGSNTKLFSKHIGFGLSRKREVLSNGISAQVADWDLEDGVPNVSWEMASIARHNRVKRGEGNEASVSASASKIQKRRRVGLPLIDKWKKTFGGHDTKFTERLNTLGNPSVYYDTISSIEDGRCATYDLHVPDTHEYCANGFFSHNTKIRGQRANYIISDEYASINPDIFETVISGFAVVSSSPIEKMKAVARKRAMVRYGLWTDKDEAANKQLLSNQSIISGTAYYSFNHFYTYWKKWKAIIESRGDREKLKQVFNSGEVPPNFDWRDYCVIRIPYDMLPEGFMDDKMIAKAKATQHAGIFSLEYGACFTGDSNGFFKRTLIESCVVGNPIAAIELPYYGSIKFSAMLKGDPSLTYVMGIDPASESDNFSITILEVWPGHRRIVYCWTTNNVAHKERVRKGLASENDFYGFIARKVRELCRLFNIKRIAMDKQGGGVSVREAFRNEQYMNPGEQMILPVIEEGSPQPTDDEAGQHILELIQFARADWVAEANHGMRYDFQSKTLLFPLYDSAKLGLAVEEDEMQGRVTETDDGPVRLYDSLEDCMLEIEEMKDELATIVHTQTGVSGRDRWDTPEVKLPGGKKGRLRKDRYSSLLMANMVARNLDLEEKGAAYPWAGGFTNDLLLRKGKSTRGTHRNPDWYEQASNSPNYGAVVRRS